jgi:O-antigen/teichoic acid export membrane protein
VLLPANLLWSWAVLFSTELILANRLITLTAIGVAVAGTNVTLNWLLIPTGSAMAAAWVSLATYGLYAGILVFWLRRNRGLGWAAWLIPTREDLRNLRIMLSGRSRKG